MHVMTAQPDSDSDGKPVSAPSTPAHDSALDGSEVQPNDEFVIAQQRLINRLEELSLVEDIARQLSGSLSFDEIIEKMLEIALRITVADRAALATLTETGGSWMLVQRRMNDSDIRKTYRTRGREDGVFSEVMRTRAPVRTSDPAQAARYATLEPGVSASVLAVPLLRGEEVIGILTVESAQADYFKEEEQTFLMHLAGHTVISIDNNRLLEEHQHRIALLSSLQFLNMRINDVLDLAGVEKAIRETARMMFQARDAALFYYDSAADALSDPRLDDDTPRRLFPSHEGLRAARTGEIQINYHTLPLGPPIQDIMAEHLPPLTYVSVPLKGSHHTQGVLSIAFTEHRQLRKRDIDAMHLLAYQASEHLEKARLQEGIRAAYDRMRAILQSTRDGVMFLDREGRLIEINTSAERLLGLNREDVINRSFVPLLFQMMKDGEISGMGYSQSQLVELARQLRTQPSRITKREFSRTRDGNTIYIEEIGSPVFDEHLNIVGRLLVLRDVTEQKHLTAFRQDIINMAVHDLRGPLGAIISGLEMALDDLTRKPNADVDRESLTKLITLSKNSAGSLIELVESVLDISRLETREIPLDRVAMPLGAVAQAAFDALQNGFEAAAIRFSTEIDPALPPAYIDPILIRRVIVNLLDNALRHTPTGGEVRLIARFAIEQRGTMQVMIADSGKGIPQAERKNLFQAFRQVKGSVPLRGARGSGLGLAFCRLAVEAHEGDIWVEDQSPLGGACIAFTLPLTPQPS
ncbi:MAG: GAF domain-containing protein [bacterium]|nr:GAF domain-containing protein [bacterium]